MSERVVGFDPASPGGDESVCLFTRVRADCNFADGDKGRLQSLAGCVFPDGSHGLFGDWSDVSVRTDWAEIYGRYSADGGKKVEEEKMKTLMSDELKFASGGRATVSVTEELNRWAGGSLLDKLKTATIGVYPGPTQFVPPLALQGLSLPEMVKLGEMVEQAVRAMGGQHEIFCVPPGVTEVASKTEGKVWRLVDKEAKPVSAFQQYLERLESHRTLLVGYLDGCNVENAIEFVEVTKEAQRVDQLIFEHRTQKGR